jgi:uncharacterized protein (TIGR02145 family)
MRKHLLTTAAVAAAIGLAVAGEPSFGTLTDTRDGQTYKTVKIGGKRWMAQNLNYKTTSGSWCYEDKTDNCDKYGRLYDWNTAKTVCPTGWKLPDTANWRALVKTADTQETAGKKLRSMSGWNWNDVNNVSGNGMDSYGFSALPGGLRYSAGDFYNAGYYGYWWTATEDDGSNAYGRGMDYYGDLADEYDYNKSNGLSVRCIADRP